ncbi:uncharacterized protein LOC132533510 [Erinaceus europaeus]|uniref:Uncharacterized protein LOC132533510 n=1 Tax=Erinaceus europaeus TaxID=9365 RepID=A0ABM3W4Q3_ERIEU|nr:uncharacterized protein LOC132533510 [Erinaceus europaeus]
MLGAGPPGGALPARGCGPEAARGVPQYCLHWEPRYSGGEAEEDPHQRSWTAGVRCLVAGAALRASCSHPVSTGLCHEEQRRGRKSHQPILAASSLQPRTSAPPDRTKSRDCGWGLRQLAAPGEAGDPVRETRVPRLKTSTPVVPSTTETSVQPPPRQGRHIPCDHPSELRTPRVKSPALLSGLAMTFHRGEAASRHLEKCLIGIC